MEPTFKIEIGSHVDMIPLVTCDMWRQCKSMLNKPHKAKSINPTSEDVSENNKIDKCKQQQQYRNTSSRDA